MEEKQGDEKTGDVSEDLDDAEKIARRLFSIADKWLLEKIGLPPDFFPSVSKESDWMVVIKCHALLETCINHLLTEHFKNPKAAKAFSRLEMSNPKAGKMAFVSACDLLPPKQRTFIQKLSEMRNFAVHDIKNFSFSFKEYISEIDPKDRNAWKKNVGFWFESDSDRNACLDGDPKDVVIMSCFMVVLRIFNRAPDRPEPTPPEVAPAQPESTPKEQPPSNQSKGRPR